MIAALALVLIVQARFFLVPLAVAVLLFSLTSAAVDVVARARIGSLAVPNWLANFVAFALIASVLMALFGIVSAQIVLAVPIMVPAMIACTHIPPLHLVAVFLITGRKPLWS